MVGPCRGEWRSVPLAKGRDYLVVGEGQVYSARPLEQDSGEVGAGAGFVEEREA